MAQLFANNAATTLAVAALAGDTSLTVVDGSKLPTPTGGDYFYLTLATGNPETAWEIVKVTARTTNALTVVRAQDGTTAQGWAIGTKAELRLPAQALRDILSLFILKAGDTGIGNLTMGALTATQATVLQAISAYWNGSAFAGTDPSVFANASAFVKAANSTPGGYDSGFAAYGATSTGTVKPVFVWEWSGTGPWTEGSPSTQTATVRLLARNASDVLVERVAFDNSGMILPGPVAFGPGSNTPGAAFTTASRGLTLQGKTGSAFDFAIYTPSDQRVMSVPTGTQNADFAASVSATRVNVDGSLYLGGYGGPASASFYKQATYGLTIAGTTGTSYDFALLTPSAGVIAYNPTGTVNMGFNGDVFINKSAPKFKASTTGFVTSAAWFEAGDATNGIVYMGREDSAGSSFGGDPYAGVFYVTGNHPFNLFTNGVKRFSVDGNASIAKFGSGSSSSVVSINGGVGNDRQLLFQTNGSTRWRLQAESTAESGGNAGSNFNLVAHSDAGATVDVVLSIPRAAGGTVAFSNSRTISMSGVNFGQSTLNAFAIGSWSPSSSNLGGTGISYSTKYTRVGDRVDFNITITGSGITATENLTKITLPFTPSVQGACSVTNTSVAPYGPGLIYTDGYVYLPNISSTGNVLITGTMFL